MLNICFTGRKINCGLSTRLPSTMGQISTNAIAGNKPVTNDADNTIPPRKSTIKMNGWQLHSYGDLEELQHTNNLKIPKIRCASDCLVRVRCTTVNPIDVAMLSYGSKVLNVMRCKPNEIEFPLIFGREFSGELVQRGMGVSPKLPIGARVWGVVPLQMNGAHAEYVTVPEYCLSTAPANLTNEEAASVLYAGLTGWSGLYITGGIGGLCGALSATGGGNYKRVLVLGGSGSVGSLAIQMLKSQGVQVLTTCSEDAVEMVRCMGADYIVDYKNPVEMDTLRDYAPYDIILDCAGQGADHVEKINLKFRQYITFTSPLLRNIDSSGMGLGLFKNAANLVETNVKSLSNNGGLVKWGFFTPSPNGILFLKKLIERRKLLPSIDSTFKFSQLPEAFKKVQDGHLRGKVVVIVS
ncbi:reticulon-4-interacting protein 1 homolog, mitochondrial isoform X2 [Teleopsis dalmanni]|uniref:reticulon-4-interacting protein 1 homolog, mitochondrial isoform X2 n=1 Tax=Teleopsis dalmanni TaxID=139649 RepID=UPI0018CD48F8|nr:reticulon-4-interacting protein 1 homolog, mitochondrial isoform X2 [Teleopsis dalmanni]